MYYRLACSIPDPSSATVLVTGGFYTPGNIVSRYGRDGWRTVLYCIVLHCTVLCQGMGGMAGWRTCHLSTWGELIMDVAAMCLMEIW